MLADPDFGPVVVCGLGGRTAELLGDVGVGLAPLRRADAAELVRSLRSFPLLEGYRGAPVTDVAALEDLLVRMAALADAHPEVAEIDCDPVLVTAAAPPRSPRACTCAPPGPHGRSRRSIADPSYCAHGGRADADRDRRRPRGRPLQSATCCSTPTTGSR